MSQIYVKDTVTGVFAHFPERVIIRTELIGETVRIYAANCIVEHRLIEHSKHRTMDYVFNHASPEEKSFIVFSEGIDDNNESSGIVALKSVNSQKLGSVIEGRINPNQDFDLSLDLDDPEPDAGVTQTQKIVKRPRFRM